MKLFIRLFITVLLLAMIAGNYLLYKHNMDERFQDTREKLMLIALNASLCIDADTLVKIPLNSDGDKAPEYRAIFQKLQKIKEANPYIKYAYIMTATDKPGIFRYIVDADPLPEIATSKSPTAFPGDEFDARNLPEMLKAYIGPSADKKFNTDAWGTTLSGYAPICDNEGKTVAIFCVDIDAAKM